MRRVPIFLLPFALLACSGPPMPSVAQRADQYCRLLAARQHIDDLMALYADDAVLEDMVSGERIIGKSNIKAFLDWGNADFSCLEAQAAVVQHKVTDLSAAVLQGYFAPFRWKEQAYGPMHFTTILTFDAQGRIAKQVDWVNYPATLLDYGRRQDSNAWIPSTKRP